MIKWYPQSLQVAGDSDRTFPHSSGDALAVSPLLNVLTLLDVLLLPGCLLVSGKQRLTQDATWPKSQAGIINQSTQATRRKSSMSPVSRILSNTFSGAGEANWRHSKSVIYFH